MLTVAAVIIGFLGLAITLVLIQLPERVSSIQLSALATGAMAFLALTTLGLYTLSDSQALKTGAICGAVVILLNIATVVRRRHDTASPGSRS
ncbi:Uncharacterised protein [Mycobacteroides abscessus subsp. bolletii]|nr:Uncharacterised protein [Mycobacteroides abscessus subsp. bolletii]SPX80343.1 Uncharacterised protein [Mycobacteroides abscessus]